MTAEQAVFEKGLLQNAAALERQGFPAMVWLIEQHKAGKTIDGVLLQVDEKGKPLEVEGEDGKKVKVVGDDGKPIPHTSKFGTSPEAIVHYIKNVRTDSASAKAGE